MFYILDKSFYPDTLDKSFKLAPSHLKSAEIERKTQPYSCSFGLASMQYDYFGKLFAIFCPSLKIGISCSCTIFLFYRVGNKPIHYKSMSHTI